MIILIPSYEPDQQLPALIRSLREDEPHVPIVVVDDGSGPQYRNVFDGVRALGCHVISYGRNRGKGFALAPGSAGCPRGERRCELHGQPECGL